MSVFSFLPLIHSPVISNIPPGPNGVRELCDRLPGRRPVSPVSIMGYSRSGRLRATASASLLQSPRYPDRICRRHARFARERQDQGPSLSLHLSLHLRPTNISTHVQWIEEANERCPGVPIILVGLKKDLRENPGAIEEMRKKSLRFVSPKEGSETATQIKARKYLECSSLTGEGVDDVFEAATRAALLTFDKRKSSCCIVL
jgi:hypothetical protein